MDLVRIFPCPKIGRNIFCDPNKKCNKHKSNRESHGVFSDDCILNFCFSKYPKYSSNENPSIVPDVVVCEKIYIDEAREGNCLRSAWVVQKFNFFEPPRLRNVASDCCIHKSAIKRDGRDFKKRSFGI